MKSIRVISLLCSIVLFLGNQINGQYSILTDFTGDGSFTGKNANWEQPLIADGSWSYGVTTEGGLYNEGTLFRMDKDGGNFEKLVEFQGENGRSPSGGLVYDGTYLYGTTRRGGVNNTGLVFRVLPDG